MKSYAETFGLDFGVYVQASQKGFRLHRAVPWVAAPCIESFPETGDIQVTRQLLAGALYAGFPQRLRDEEALNDGEVTAASPLLRHVYWLAGACQTMSATTPTMHRVAERLLARGRSAAAAYCRHVAEEESGHGALARMDLAALGLPAQEVMARLRPRTAPALVELFTRLADSAEPIAVLGYGYALERTALLWTEEAIVKIERLIPEGINATRCLRVHSVAGAEVAHVAEAVEFISSLPPNDRAAIARATYETSLLHGASWREYPGDATMRAVLDEFGWSMRAWQI